MHGPGRLSGFLATTLPDTRQTAATPQTSPFLRHPKLVSTSRLCTGSSLCNIQLQLSCESLTSAVDGTAIIHLIVGLSSDL